MEYVTRGVCGQEGCRERKYYLDNGLWFCRRGHLQEGRQVEEDGDDFGTQGKTHRVRRESEERSRKRVVRDLWALRVRMYSSRIHQIEDHESNDTDGPELFSSQAESSDETGVKVGGKYLEWPRMLDTVALCYLAAILMRLPRLPDVETLHRGFEDLVLYYRRRFELAVPRLNYPIITYRYIKRLAIPSMYLSYWDPISHLLFIEANLRKVDVYEVTKTLRGLLGFNFEYAANFDRKRPVLRQPEVQIMVLVIISTKLLFPFDDILRNPATPKEPSAQAMDWERWAHAQRQFDFHPHADGNIGKEMMIKVSDTDVLNMTANQLDEYMDWYEQSWRDTTRPANPIAELFPISRAGPEVSSDNLSALKPQSTPDKEEDSLNELLQTVMEGLSPIAVRPDANDTCPRPGSWYRRYRWESSIPSTARPFYELAARLAGVSFSTLFRAVTVAEWRLAHWQERRRRPGQMNDGLEDAASEDDSEDRYEGENVEHDVNEENLEELQGQLLELDV
ncbi:hypothetical protein N7468_001041 [Penicillium chermesinum]|uniref:RRN7-type domain-containing protein n=1 Tax=Penicillium chermesinum TaxID=63820 RepID=A0A9W9PI27_9EURO|nr:uncharacterized protein N7468_001041 [Penicillium chermesinum]KAJ5246058.1 hypothetical protein N7468_001041 [Penicillium chermesinum]